MKLSNFRLEEQRITEVVFKIKKENILYEGSYDFHTKIDILKNKDIMNKAKVILMLEVFRENEFDKPFYLKNIIEGVFSWENNIFTEEQISLLLKENAPAVLLSYIRTNTSLITISAGLKPLVIPLINFKGE